MKEAILLIRELWRGERVTYDGTFYRVSNATIYDRPEQEVPIYIGASGPAATRLAGRIADGWITTSGKDPSLYTETLIPAFEDGLAKGGQANVDRMLEVKVSFRPDRARALENTRFWAPLALSPEEKTGVHDPVEMQRLAEKLPIERAASRFIVSDDPDEHVAQIQRYLDLGFTHLVFHDPGHDQADFLDIYGRDVLPKLRAAVA
jgi:coenzyme F420-dependent glucose-6-phosphate dehydrogenase